jgi:hypothetical protein
MVPAGVKADVAEALDDEGLVAPARGLTNHGHVGGLQDEVLQPVVHAATRRRGAAMDTALNKRHNRVSEGMVYGTPRPVSEVRPWIPP